MSDCLVTKLKASVNNPALKKLGVFSVTTTGISIEANQPVSVYLDGVFQQTNTSFAFTGTTMKICEVYNKYAITSLTFIKSSSAGNFSVNVEDFSMCVNLQTLNLTNSVMRSLTGSLDDFPNLPVLTSLTLGNTRLPDFSGGSFSEFARIAPNLTTLNLPGSQGINGSIESLVSAYRANGRTSGTINAWLPTSVTFNGGSITRADAGNLTWTATTITWDGVTITA